MICMRKFKAYLQPTEYITGTYVKIKLSLQLSSPEFEGQEVSFFRFPLPRLNKRRVSKQHDFTERVQNNNILINKRGRLIKMQLYENATLFNSMNLPFLFRYTILFFVGFVCI